jgi:hypothetical protein
MELVKSEMLPELSELLFELSEKEQPLIVIESPKSAK